MKLKSQPMIMGILNVTPDSFYDGGHHFNPSYALKHAQKMIDEGVDIIDIGGESTRPGATPVAIDQELERVVPILKAIKQHFDIPVSVDTRRAKVMQAVLELGADCINDVAALTDEHALETVAKYNPYVCLMHMQNLPHNMQNDPTYASVINEIKSFLSQRKDAAIAAGIAEHKIMLDPGIGFGKQLEHNLEIISSLETFKELGSPMVIGVSRKSMFEHLLGLEVEQRLAATLGATAIAVWHGASIVRTHDVKATKECVSTVHAIKLNQGR